jgi:hypothetical protein
MVLRISWGIDRRQRVAAWLGQIGHGNAVILIKPVKQFGWQSSGANKIACQIQAIAAVQITALAIVRAASDK